MLPPKVRAVIRRRLALLSPGAQALAETAAVIGRAFTFAVLAHASGQDEAAVVQGLDELWRRRIVREQGADAYDFSHDKIRAVAYADLSPIRRRAAHLRAAEALVAVYRAELDPMSAQIAEHNERAGLLEQAVTYYRQAASAAQRVFAFSDALDLLKRAVSLLSALSDDASRRQKSLQLHEQIGDIHGWVAHHDSALEAYRVAQESTSADAILDRTRAPSQNWKHTWTLRGATTTRLLLSTKRRSRYWRRRNWTQTRRGGKNGARFSLSTCSCSIGVDAPRR